MVFSSVPLYLDPPNWQQHPNQQVLQGGNNNNNNNPGNHDQSLHLIPPQQQPRQLGVVGGSVGGPGGGGQQIRPNSMAEQARLAKIPPPEAPLKCPRCESTNTKFCYFNNYSLSQPRHFCKTCRRYWTRGGALRNVPVGGGCRRNKRTSSKSSSGGGAATGPSSSSKSSLSSPMGITGGERHSGLDHFMTSSGISSLSSVTGLPSGVGNNTSFVASLQNIAQLGGMTNNMGLAFGGGGSLHNTNHNSNNTNHPSNHNNLLGGGGVLGSGDPHHNNMDFPQLSHHHHQQQQEGSGVVQFPNFLGGFEIPGSTTTGGAGLYSSSFQGDSNNHHQDVGCCGGGGGGVGDDHEQVSNISKSLTTMMSPVKMEDSAHHGLNLAKQLMGITSSADNNVTGGGGGTNPSSNGNQFWGGVMSNTGVATTSMWTDLSGLNSSSTSHLL